MSEHDDDATGQYAAHDRRQFARRSQDTLWLTLDTRVTTLEKTVNTQLVPEVRENTRLTADTNVKNDEMYSAFVTARNGVRLITAVGNGVMGAAEYVAGKAKTFLILTFTFGAIYAFFKTGKIPDWLDTFVKSLL